MGSIYYFGRRVTSGDVGLGTINSDRQRFYIPNALTTTIIAVKMGFFGGRVYGTSGNPPVRLSVADVTTGGVPGTLLKSTGVIYPTQQMSYGGDGTYLEGTLEAPVLMTPKSYSLGISTGGPGVNHGMIAAASISATDESFYDKACAAGWYPTNPVGGSESNQGHMSVCVVGYTNTAPSKPSALSPSGSIADGDLTPQMQSTFDDAEELLPGGIAWDYVTSVRIQVQTSNGASTKWDHTYTANSTERANDRTNITYAGQALTAGTTYRWRILHTDRAGAQTWSDWVTFNINPGGTVATPTAPTGKQTTLTPSGATAKWTHAGGLSMNAAIARLYNDSGQLMDTSGTITKSATNGGTFTLTWAEMGFPSLVQGEGYSVEIKGRDTGSVWSPYSGKKSFTVNATPLTPSGLSPSGTVTSLPKLSGKTSDPDNTTSTLTMTVEITRANDTVVTRTVPYVSGTTFSYQTTTTDLPAPQTFSYRMKASDGSFTSAWSSPVTVIYGTGPAVTITSPADNAVLTTSTPTITWTAAGQVQRIVVVSDLEDGSVVHSSGYGTTTSQTYTIPAGILRNDKSYEVVVGVTNAVPLQGVASPLTFSLSFVPPDPITGFVAYPIQVGSDLIPSAIEMDWDMSIYPQSQFAGYDIFRRALSGAYEPGEEQLVWLRRITSPLQTTFVDYHARSGVAWEYIATQSIIQDADVIQSEDVTVQSQIELDDVLLVSALDPTVYRMNLRYTPGGGGMSHELKREQRQAVPVGSRVGRTVRSAYRAWEDGGTFMVVTDSQKTADERIKEIRDAVEFGRTFSFRDHKNRRRWVTIASYREMDRGKYYEIDLQLREEEFVEGEDPSALLGE